MLQKTLPECSNLQHTGIAEKKEERESTNEEAPSNL
jgi:hypothetical protein